MQPCEFACQELQGKVMLSVMPLPVPGCWGNTSCLVQLTSAAYLWVNDVHTLPLKHADVTLFA